jgi:hypothetical protein
MIGAPTGPRPRIPLFSGLFDRCKIGVVCTAGALRGRVPIAALITVFRVRRAAGDFLNDLTYYAGFILHVSSTVCGPAGTSTNAAVDSAVASFMKSLLLCECSGSG